jgi:hypothetical protein
MKIQLYPFFGFCASYIRPKNLGLSGVEAITNGKEFAGVAGQLILIYICVSEFR